MGVLSVAASSNFQAALPLVDTICAVRRRVPDPPGFARPPFHQCSVPRSLALGRGARFASPLGSAPTHAPWRETRSQTLSLLALRSEPHRSARPPSGRNFLHLRNVAATGRRSPLVRQRPSPKGPRELLPSSFSSSDR